MKVMCCLKYRWRMATYPARIITVAIEFNDAFSVGSMYTHEPASALAGFTYKIHNKNAKAATLTAMIAAIPFQRLRDSSAGTIGMIERRFEEDVEAIDV
tara:strand:- start:618 stop:914 length:297 start_codon:yes stop_codon:yes gene_type:complete